jgi:hypothetical protein
MTLQILLSLFLFSSLFLLYLNYQLSLELSAVTSRAENLEALASKLQTKLGLLETASAPAAVSSNSGGSNDLILAACLFFLSAVCIIALNKSLSSGSVDILSSNSSISSFNSVTGLTGTNRGSSCNSVTSEVSEKSVCVDVKPEVEIIDKSAEVGGLASDTQSGVLDVQLEGVISQQLSDLLAFAKDIQEGVLESMVNLDALKSGVLESLVNLAALKSGVLESMVNLDALKSGLLNMNPDSAGVLHGNVYWALDGLETQIRQVINSNMTLTEAIVKSQSETATGAVNLADANAQTAINAHTTSCVDELNQAVSESYIELRNGILTHLQGLMRSNDLLAPSITSRLDALAVQLQEIQTRLDVLAANGAIADAAVAAATL